MEFVVIGLVVLGIMFIWVMFWLSMSIVAINDKVDLLTVKSDVNQEKLRQIQEMLEKS